jgi:hypothetical protein
MQFTAVYLLPAVLRGFNPPNNRYNSSQHVLRYRVTSALTVQFLALSDKKGLVEHPSIYGGGERQAAGPL